jgi:hypothetical protein
VRSAARTALAVGALIALATIAPAGPARATAAPPDAPPVAGMAPDSARVPLPGPASRELAERAARISIGTTAVGLVIAAGLVAAGSEKGAALVGVAAAIVGPATGYFHAELPALAGQGANFRIRLTLATLLLSVAATALEEDDASRVVLILGGSGLAVAAAYDCSSVRERVLRHHLGWQVGLIATPSGPAPAVSLGMRF